MELKATLQRESELSKRQPRPLQKIESSRENGLQVCRETWSEENCGYLDYIIQHESGWVVGIWNTEGCAGLAQACPASKLGEAYGNLRGEVEWAMRYALQRYNNSPKQAYEHWLTHKSW